MRPQLLPGFRDFFPDQFAVRAYIFETWRRVVRRYGFVEYDGPPLEPLELYTLKSGDEIVKQLYAFEDKGGRAVAMRPEMTPTFARMVALKAQSLKKPIRWFSIPHLFRYERQQKGRLREHFQLNVDVVGEPHVMADAELLSVLIEVMREFGFTSSEVVARVSDRRLLDALLGHLGIPEERWVPVRLVLDKLERQPRDISAEKLAEAGLDAATVDIVMGFDTLTFEQVQARYGEAPAVAAQVQRFAEYLQMAEALGIREWMRFDLTIVRGLAYYTGIVFELFDTVGEFRAICGGGRYDTLLDTLGGVDLPALGFGFGDVVLGELLKARGKLPTFREGDDRYFIVAGEGVRAEEVLTVGSKLRRHIPGVEITYGLNRAAIEGRRSNKQADEGRAMGANTFLHLTRTDELSISVSVSERKETLPVDAAVTHTLASPTVDRAADELASISVQAMARSLQAAANTQS
ncbi:MAG: ATP phosphoribosyltransferase regulatory subunit [Phycisphaerae bacterium]|nr:ATP phosphoribosyltransferase regulatory subunit [Gemmatimonadaceae bacterium]